MIKYYAYYNHGGYKDFYLGSQNDDSEFKYHLPLLSVHEQSLLDNPDEERLKQVERQKQLPKLIVLSDKTVEYNYPTEARTLMSHSGYKIIFRTYSVHCHILAIRDIPGGNDIFGRGTPFNIMLIGDNDHDLQLLSIVAEYARTNLTNFDEHISKLFENDFVENGLKFHLKAINDEIARIAANNSPTAAKTTSNRPVHLMVLPRNVTLQTTLKEQKIQLFIINTCYSIDGVILYKYNPTNQSTPPETKSPSSSEPRSPLHSILNMQKQDEIKKLWDYIYMLEQRINKLENRQ